MKLVLLYTYILLALINLSGCAPPKVIKTEAPIDFQFIQVLEGDTLDSIATKYNGSDKFSWRIEEFNNNPQLTPGEELIIPLKPFSPGGLKAQGYQLIPVLSYHNFSHGRSHNKLTVSAKNFRKQLSYLKDNGYHVINMDQLIEFIEFGQVPEKSVLITIDDGWISTYEIAYPILKEFGFNATLFIPSQYIESGNKKAINWAQIKEMVSDSTIDIQCHGKAHRDLSVRKRNESFTSYVQAVEQDISSSKQTIYNKLGTQVTALAYPFGNTNPIVMEILKQQGYTSAFTVTRKGNPFYIQRFLLNRSMVYGTTNINKFVKDLKSFENFPISETEPIDSLRSLASLALENPEQYETKKQWRTARLAWKLRRDRLLSERQILAKKDPEASAKLRSLKKAIEDAQYKVSYMNYKLKDIAKQYYLAATKTKQKDQARKLLLQALLNNPDDQNSIDLFQSGLGALKPVSYQVKANDSFKSIAKQLYKDPKKSIIIPLFNENINNESDLKPGMTLSLPAPPINIKTKAPVRPRACNIRLIKPANQMADDYYAIALENFDHDQVEQAIKNLKTAICLNPEHNQAVEMLDMLKDL